MKRTRNPILSPIFLSALFLSLFINTAHLLAQDEVEYDPYAPILKYPEVLVPDYVENRERNQWMARILEQPLRPIGYAVGKTAEWVERKHMDDKAIWFIDELATHGVYPKIMTPTEGSFGTIGPGGRIDVLKLLNVEQSSISLDVFGGWTPNKDFAGTTVELGGKYKFEPLESPFFQDGVFRYRRSSSEAFYGIGQDTSLGEHSVYKPEEVWLEGGLGYHLTQNIESHASFVFQKMNIGNGAQERVGKIKEHFPVARIPGINGGDIIGLTTSLIHDNRDDKNDTKRGGEETLGFSYFHDVDGSDLHYLKMSGTIRHFFPIFSDRRILAVRLSAEKNQELGGGEIPFYNLSRLGGSDIADGSELLRSYKYNRFFEEGLLSANVEYRYNIYDYSDFKVDAFGLFDVGEVFGELGDFGIEELKLSFGGGFNLKFRKRTLLSLVIARGNEGWKAGSHTKVSF
jgi:hypothetical protein